MIPQTRAGTQAWPGGGGAASLPGTGLAALSRPAAIAEHGMWPISTWIYRWRAWTSTGERKKQTSMSDPDSVGPGFQ